MTPNQPCRNPNEVWPEIAEALQGFKDGPQAVSAALQATVKCAKGALHNRCMGSEDPRSKAVCLLSEILPDQEMADAKRLYGQLPETVKTARYKRVDGVFVEETFPGRTQDGYPASRRSTKGGKSIQTGGSIQISRGEKPKNEHPHPALDNRSSRKAAWWDRPFGIFERSVPEHLYFVRHALREYSSERPDFIASLLTGLDAQVLAVERDREMLRHASRTEDPITETRDALAVNPAYTQLPAEKGAIRKAFVDLLLRHNGWSLLDWALECKVAYNTVKGYYRLGRNCYNDTRVKLAKGSKISVEQLPP